MKTQNRLQFPAILLAVFLVLIVTSCEVDKEENKPVVATNEVTAIKSTEALCGGVITSDGGFTITSCGVCWSTDSIPTINDNKTTDSIGAGCFTSQISGLQPKSNYYVRAYATNSEGTGYGMAMAFETYGAAVLTTAEVTEISYTTAVCGGAITSDGGQTITVRGVCWSTSPDSVELESASGFTVNGSGVGTFESKLTNLSPGINYYVRAYATNSIETYYGNINSFETTTLPENSFIDSRDGNVYKYVTIGSQVWMAENLRYLPEVVGSDTGSNTTPYFYVYGYDGTDVAEVKVSINFTIYGVLYNWPAAMSGSVSSTSNPSDVQGICPSGWHLPSDDEWLQLCDYLGGDSIAGGKLKEDGITYWDSPNKDATNETGFTALPGGYRNNSGNFGVIGNYGSWWSSSELSTNYANYRFLLYNSFYLNTNNINKEIGFSVRCVRD